MASPDPNPVTDTDGDDPTRPRDAETTEGKGEAADPTPEESVEAQPQYPT